MALAGSLSAQSQTPYFAIRDGLLDGYLHQFDNALRGSVRNAPVRVEGILPITLTGIAAHPVTGTLYGVTDYTGFYYPGSLVTIDPSTGIAKLIGSLGNSRVSDITFDIRGNLFAWDYASDRVAQIDPSTAKVTLLGASGAMGAPGALAASAGGTLYAAVNSAFGALRSIDPATGQSSVIATLSGAPQTFAMNSMTFAPDGTLYAINAAANEREFPGDQPHLVAINPATGAVSDLGLMPPGIDGITFGKFAASSTLPAAPANFACVAGNRTITCTFDKPSESQTVPLPSSYILRCGTATLNSRATVTGFASPLIVTGLKGNNGYHCAASAINIDGEGPGSSRAFVVPDASLATTGSVDADGDGASEILLRSAAPSTQSAAYDFVAKRLAFTTLRDPGGDWQILGTGDFTGIHRSATLLQNGAGTVKICFEFQCAFDSELTVRSVKPGWVVEAMADIDGDGKSDIVWRYAAPNTVDTGAIFVWFMNGASAQEIKVRGGAPLSWTIVGAADIDGNGMADIVLQTPTGEIRALMGQTGRNYTNQPIAILPPGYNALKTADFNGDGRADLLLRNASSGAVTLWLLNGAGITSTVVLPATDPAWSFYAAGDYNGDGLTDVVWKKADGTLVLWLMNPGDVSTPTVIDGAGTAPAGFTVIKP